MNHLKFPDFLRSVARAKPHQHMRADGARVADHRAFCEMQDHLLSFYGGIEVQGSATDANGQIFDFVPIEQQPALRGRALAKAPPLPPAPGQDVLPEEQPKVAHHGLGAIRDTIPIRRLTLGELIQSPTLADYFRKTPGGGDRIPVMHDLEYETADYATVTGPAAAAHKYAHAFQNVPNLGGHSTLSVWRPGVDTTKDQIFSLSQHWYVAGGNVAGDNRQLQTLEVGLVVEPGQFGTVNPTLFVAMTADGYATFYINLSGALFVQTNASWIFGGSLVPQSTAGSQPYEVDIAVHLVAGNWWVYVGTPGFSPTAVGYYPVSVYGTNGSMVSGAVQVDYGGEVTGYSSWPPMGSGSGSNTGYKNAAYHKNVYYYPSGGGSAVNATLTAQTPSPTFYSATLGAYGSPWNTTLFFGGAGGTLRITVSAASASGSVTIAGNLVEYYYRPTLQYQDDGGIWTDFPSSATVTTQVFSFVHPNMTLGTHTVSVRDAFFTQIVGTSPAFTV